MLVQLREVEKFFGETVRLAFALVEQGFEPLVLRVDQAQLVTQIRDAIVIRFLVGVPDVRAMEAPENDCRAIALMLEDVPVGVNLLAPALPVTALELDFR